MTIDSTDEKDFEIALNKRFLGFREDENKDIILLFEDGVRMHLSSDDPGCGVNINVYE